MGKNLFFARILWVKRATFLPANSPGETKVIKTHFIAGCYTMNWNPPPTIVGLIAITVFLTKSHTCFRRHITQHGPTACIFRNLDEHIVVGDVPVSYTHLRAHETPEHLVC